MPREVTAEQRGAAEQSVKETSQQKKIFVDFFFFAGEGAITLCNDFNPYPSIVTND